MHLKSSNSCKGTHADSVTVSVTMYHANICFGDLHIIHSALSAVCGMGTCLLTHEYTAKGAGLMRTTGRK